MSRLLGEFSKQEPDIEVNSDDEKAIDALTVKVVQQHLRHVLLDTKNQHTRYEVYKDLLSGGFSVLEVKTDYQNSMSMKQEITITRCFDPTLCGFDSLARMSHKGDGRFCYALSPMAKEDFMEAYPDIPVGDISFRRDFAGFNWSYLNDNTEIILVADYYKKVKKEKMICELADGRVMTTKQYRKLVNEWDDITMPPAIVGKPRKTMIEQIERYRMIENQILEHEVTDYTHLPLIFVDGNSAMIKTPKNGNVRQVTRPYFYHAKSAQRLKNFAGICWANEIENTVQHKFMVAKEALPKEELYLEAYKDVQKASVLVYNSMYEGNPDQPINNPLREVQRVPMPPEISGAFTACDSLMQNILGSYDASLGINNNQLSGIAMIEGATQSNAAAMPYVVGFCQGLSRAAEIYVDLMPKYFKTPRTLPILDDEGKRQYVMINQPEGMEMDFNTNALNVVVKAGASFQVQKSRTIMMVKEMMGMSPIFAQFIAEKGLNFVLDNMEGKGIEELKGLVEEWTKEMEEQKKQAQQQQQQNPAAIKAQIDMAKLEHQKQKDSAMIQLDMKKLEADQQKLMVDMRISQDQSAVGLVKAQTERFAKQVDLEIKKHDMRHRHLKEALETHHKIKQGHKEHAGRH
jgi:rhodanese-related sulfurtransferase